MNKKRIDQEWKKLKIELFENRPKIDMPYPPCIVRRRELLLLTQIHLGNIIGDRTKNNKRVKDFEAEMYDTVISAYYSWDKQ